MRKLPWILKGQKTFIRNRLLKRYTLNELMEDDIWYAEVIEAPERDFFGIHSTDLQDIYNYFAPTPDNLLQILKKYGNNDQFTVVVEYLLELYNTAYENAIKYLQQKCT